MGRRLQLLEINQVTRNLPDPLILKILGAPPDSDKVGCLTEVVLASG